MKVFKVKLVNFYRENEEKYFRFIILVSVITVANILYALFVREHVIMLNENQILYVFSVVAQVVAALMGLIIATYGLLDSRNKPDKDDAVYELYCNVKNKQFIALLKVCFTAIITILLCLSAISLYEISKQAFDIVSSEGILLFLIVIIYVCIFAMMLDPKEINKEGDKISNLYNASYSTKTKTKTSSFETFSAEYSRLEQLIIRFALEIDSSKAYGYARPTMKLSDALNILLENGVIDNIIIYIIDDLKRCKGAFAYSTNVDKKINIGIVRKLKSLYVRLERLYHRYIEDNKQIQGLSNTKEAAELKKYAKENWLSDLDKKMLNNIDYIIDGALIELPKDTYYRQYKRLRGYERAFKEMLDNKQ